MIIWLGVTWINHECEEVDHVDNGYDVDNEVQGTPIVVCRGPVGGWAAVWPQLRHYS